MELKIKVPKKTVVEIGQKIPLTKMFKHSVKDVVALVIVKERLSDEEILVEVENIDIKCGGVMDDNKVFKLKELSLIPIPSK